MQKVQKTYTPEFKSEAVWLRPGNGSRSAGRLFFAFYIGEFGLYSP